MEYEDRLSSLIDLSLFDTHGFCPDYTLRRHKYESLANAGCHEARTDWANYITPVHKFGGCNPINGNFTAVVLPLCKPERLRLVAYVLEYAFLHDNVVESIESNTDGDAFTLGGAEEATAHVKAGRKQLQAKMAVQLASMDSECAERVMRVWKTMLSTTLEDKSNNFNTLEEYLDFRIVDTGAPFVESILLFGIGMTLTEDEDKQLVDVVRPCYASLALANDYFSFDREWEEAQEPGAPKPVNAVWHYMRWQGVDVATAKRLVRDAANTYERMYLGLCDEFRKTHAPISEKLDRYLDALGYQISGNVVWSLNCPRYHPRFRYDPNAGLEDEIMATSRYPPKVEEDDLEDQINTSSGQSSETASMDGSTEKKSSPPLTPTSTVYSDDQRKASISLPTESLLGLEHLQAPHDYVSSLPSKGVRGQLIDALNLWAQLPEHCVSGVKGLVDHLHNASLILDDIEDSSDLRRGQPAAHIVFGVPQTINAGSFAILESLQKAKDLPIANAMNITLEQLQELHIGQSYDLHWTRHGTCPSEEEYLEMVTKKTGGLFKLLSRLMSEGLDERIAIAIDTLMTQMGMYFQIRDDYQNLNSSEYESQKGFCEDLDEGKPSFPLIHCLNAKPEDLRLRGVLQRQHDDGSLSKPLKGLALRSLEDAGSLEYTKKTLDDLESQIDATIGKIEGITGKTNWLLRMILQKLSV